MKAEEGFNALTDKYEDLVEAGVIDPTKVVRSALQNAASIASLLLTTEALVSRDPGGEEGSAGARRPRRRHGRVLGQSSAGHHNRQFNGLRASAGDNGGCAKSHPLFFAELGGAAIAPPGPPARSAEVTPERQRGRAARLRFVAEACGPSATLAARCLAAGGSSRRSFLVPAGAQ